MNVPPFSKLPDDFLLSEGAYPESLAYCEAWLESDPDPCCPPAEDDVRAAYYIVSTQSTDSSSYRLALCVLFMVPLDGSAYDLAPEVRERVCELFSRMPIGHA